MAIDVVFEYDADRGIVFTVDEGTLGTPEEVDEFISLNRDYFTTLGKKVWVVSNIDGLKIRPPVADYYGESVRTLVEEWVLGHVRYGQSPPSRMTVRTSYLRAKIDPNIYGTREEALEAIERMQLTIDE